MHLSKIKNIISFEGSRTDVLKKNAIGMAFIKLLSMLIEFVKVPLILSYLSTEVYGVWLTIVSLVLWTQNFDFGLSSGLKYKFTELLAKGDDEGARGIVSTAYFSFGGLMIIVFCCLSPLIFHLDWNGLLNVYTVSSSELSWTVFVVFFFFVVQLVAEQMTNLLRADQKAAIADVFKPIANVISLGLVLLIGMFSTNSLFFASIAMAAPYAVLLVVINIFFFSSRYQNYRPSFGRVSKKYLKDIYSLGLKFFISQLSSLVVFSSANLLISHFLSPEDVSIYSTARTYFGLILVFNGVVLVPVMTAITDAYAKNEFVWLKENMKKVFKVEAFFAVGVIFMFFLSEWFISLWTGNRISIPMDLSISLTLYSLLNLVSMTYSNFVAGVGKMTLTVIINLVKIVFYLPLAIFALQYFGLSGIVWTIILVNTIPNCVFNIIQYYKIISGRATGIWNR